MLLSSFSSILTSCTGEGSVYAAHRPQVQLVGTVLSMDYIISGNFVPSLLAVRRTHLFVTKTGFFWEFLRCPMCVAN